MKKFIYSILGFGTFLNVAFGDAFAEGYTDITEAPRATIWDFPAGRCGGHAHTGVRWTAPKAASIDIQGGAWMARDRNGTTGLSLWVKGAKLIDRASARGNSTVPKKFADMISDNGGDPVVLRNLQVNAGDEVYVQIDGNEFTGLDMTIGKGPDRWDLQADFSESSNPSGAWAFGEVVVDAQGKPKLNVFETKEASFDPEDFGPGQPAWHSAKLPWFWSFMRSGGPARPDPDIRLSSANTIYAETLQGGRWVGRYWSADGRINLPNEGWMDDAFQLAINGEPLTNGWTWVSRTEVEKTQRGARHYVVELAHASRHVRLKVHTLLDGTAVFERWLEISNTSAQPLAVTSLAPWSGRLWLTRRGYANYPPQAFSLGYFTRQDWAAEGWFEWRPLTNGTVSLTCDQARSHDDPFFIVRNDAAGEYFIGHLAWTTQWRLEFERNDSGLLFRIGPWAEQAALRVLAPGETIRTPSVHLGSVAGELDSAVQSMHDHLRRSVLPTRPADRSYLIQYLVPADQGYYLPFDESSAMKCVDVAAAIGAELFILDYGWWDVSLDWYPSTTRFPHGLGPLIEYVRKKGMRFGLYVRAEGDAGDVPNSKVAKAHPDWIGPSNTVNLYVPEAAAWVESEVGRLTEQHGLDLYRLDYNPTFKFGATSRFGIMENNCWRYYDAFYGMYERIHRKYPNLILQQASAGGARNDLGTVSRFHEPYLTDGLSIPREFQIYSGLTLGLPPENFVILHGADGGVGLGKPQNLDTVLRLSYTLATPQIFVGSVGPSIETLSPQRKARFLHYGRVYREFIRPLFPTCKVYHHEPVNSRGGVTSSGWFAMEFAAPDRAQGWATLVRMGPADSDTYLFKPRGLDPAKSYSVTFDSLDVTVTVTGLSLIREGLPIRLEAVGASELLLFRAR